MNESSVAATEIDTTMEKVVKEIYSSCDPDNINSVLVSKLIDFVKPFLLDNTFELQQLREKLDPDNNNPSIGRETFYAAMNEWTCNVIGNITTKTESTCENDWDLPFVQSTPRSSFGYCELINKCPGILSISNIVSYEISDNSNTVSDKTPLEEQVRQLQYQVHKTVNELVVVKQQLAVAEEQNESLLADLNKLTRNLQSEQQSKEQCRQNQIETDDYKENLLAANKRIEMLEKMLVIREKERQNLLDEIKELESKKTCLESKLEIASKQNGDAQKEITNMRSEIEEKETEISKWIKTVEEMKVASNEKEELIEFYSNESKLAKCRAATLEKVFCYRCTSQAESFLNKITNSEPKQIDSPKLLNATAHPFSPLFDISKFEEPTQDSSTPLKVGRIILENILPDEIERYPKLSLINNNDPSSSAINQINENDSTLMMSVISEDSKTSDSIFTNAVVAHSSRSPHKSLQEEIFEALKKTPPTECFEMRLPHYAIPWQNFNKDILRIPEGAKELLLNSKVFADETSEDSEVRVQYLLSHLATQEHVNKNIWNNMRLLKSQVETLSSYKENYEQLEKTCEEQSKIINVLKDTQNKDYEQLMETCKDQAKVIDELRTSSAISKDYREAHEKMEKTFGEQERVIDELRSWKSDLENKCENQVKTIEELEENLKEVKNNANNDLRKLLEDYDKLQESYLEVESKCSNLSKENQSLQETLKSLEETLKNNNEELADVKKLVTAIIKTIEDRSGNYSSFNLTPSSGSVSELLSNLQIMVNVILTSFNVPKAINETVIENKKSSAFKLELRNEKLKEKIERLERDLLRERNARSEFEKNCQDLEQQITEKLTEKYSIEIKTSEENLHKTVQDLKESHSEIVNNIRMDLEEVAEIKNFLEDENKILSGNCRNLKQSLGALQLQWNEAKQKNEELIASLLKEKSIIKDLQEDNLQLLKKLKLLEVMFDEKESSCSNLIKQVATLESSNQFLEAELQKMFEENEEQIIEFREKTRTAEVNKAEIIEEIRYFMTNNCKELSRLTSTVVAFNNFSEEENEIVREFLDYMPTDQENFSSPLKSEMYQLAHQIKVAIALLELVSSKWLEMHAPTPSASEPQSNLSIDKSRSENEDSFESCCCDQKEIPFQESFPRQSDSFLRDLELDDYSPRVVMSRKEMDEKFTALALVFTIDFKTSKERYRKQTKRYLNLVQKFNDYTTSAIDLLKKVNSEGRCDSVITYLEMLKGESLDIFTSAEQCGALRYEVRNMKCWNFVSNYVAVLSQESRRIEQIGAQIDDSNNDKLKVLSCCNVNQYEYLPESNKIPSSIFRRGFFKAISLWFFMFLFVILVLLVSYVQWECSTKFRNRVCPLDNFVESCIHRTYTDRTF